MHVHCTIYVLYGVQCTVYCTQLHTNTGTYLSTDFRQDIYYSAFHFILKSCFHVDHLVLYCGGLPLYIGIVQ